MKNYLVIVNNRGMESRTKRMSRLQAEEYVKLSEKLYPGFICTVKHFPEMRIIK